jgi:hypothetical protein
MMPNNDNSFPYVLLCSTFGTVVSLAAVWFAIAVSQPSMIGV